MKIYRYQHGNICIQINEQGKTMMGDDQDLHILGIIITEYILKQGLQSFCTKSEEGITKELTHLHDNTIFIPMDPGSLTKEQLSSDIAFLVFLKDRICGEIKGRACDKGKKNGHTSANNM